MLNSAQGKGSRDVRELPSQLRLILNLAPLLLQEATDLAKRSKDIRDVALALQREERSGNKGRNWRKNVRRVERVSVAFFLPVHS